MGLLFLLLSLFSIIFKTSDCTIDLAPFCDLKALVLEAQGTEAMRFIVLNSEQVCTYVHVSVENGSACAEEFKVASVCD